MIWKPLDANSDYEISDTGLVRKWKKESGKYFYPAIFSDKDGYLQVRLHDSGKGRNARVHRLVLHAFAPCENEAQLEVHHIDEDPTNNTLSNLCWCTHEENIRFINPDKLASNTQFIAQKINQYDLDGNYITTYNSMNAALRAIGSNGHHIGEVCRGKRKTAAGFKWSYFEGSTTNSNEKSHEAEDTIGEDIV